MVETRTLLLTVAGAALLAGWPAVARAAAPATTPAPDDSATVSDIVVTAQKLDAARQTIQPDVGASTYTVTAQLIDGLPGGDNVGLNTVILQMPGVVQDSFGQLHVRGDHANLQYRLNGVILPEGLSVFGQTLSPRLADSVELITGALPAEFGLRTAGIIDIKTKSGFRDGGEASIYGGSHGTIQPSVEYGGSSGSNSYFVSGSYLQDDLGIELPDGRSTPLHDRTGQYQVFGYFDHVIDPSSRLSLIAGASDQRFQIPDIGGLNAFTDGSGLTINGQSQFASEQLNQNQREQTDYLIASYLHATEKLTGLLSVFGRLSRLDYRPDVEGELLFNEIAQAADKRDLAGGVQAEGVYDLTPAHTLRAGLVFQLDHGTSRSTSDVLTTPVNPFPADNVPIVIDDNTAKTSTTYSAYLQDEWKLADSLTLNYGLRFDDVEAYRNESQFSPRVNFVWTPLEGTTVHGGYARYFTPTPFELVAAPSVAKFIGATAQPQVLTDTTPFAERANYYDVGVQQKLGASLTVGLDGYWRQSHNLIDEGQFGAPIILTPFNYEDGRIKGIEANATYAKGPLSAYANLAVSQALGRDIVSSQFNFDPVTELAYIATHFIHLDHDQTYTASAGVAYRAAGNRFSADVIYGSGLRADDPLGIVPNGGTVSGYTVVNLGVAHSFGFAAKRPLEVRLDLVNALDRKYLIRDGSGVGVGAPQWGERRGLYAGISKAF